MPDAILALLALPPEGSTISTQIDALHVFVITTTMVSSFLVFAAAAYFVVRYKRKHEGQLTVRVTATVWSEGTIIVGILGLFVLWWVIGFRQYVEMRDPPEDAMTIYVTAKQWMWKFTYPDGRSANDVLTIPAWKPVKLAMTSRDVIHSFFVPAFRMKQDVLPGRIRRQWFEARPRETYPIYCAEYCGVSHSMMRGSVVVLSREDYDAWLGKSRRATPAATADLAEAGREVARRRECVACHTIDRAASHRADVGGPLRDAGSSERRAARAGRRGLPHALDDGAGRRHRGRLQERHADVLLSPTRARDGGARRVHQVAARCSPRSGVALPTLEITPIEVADAGAPGSGASPSPGEPMSTIAIPPSPGRPARASERRILRSRVRCSRGCVTTDHKRIGILYLVVGLLHARCSGGVFALLIRIEHLTPGADDHGRDDLQPALHDARR